MLTGVFRIDSIKKAARREAWYQRNEDGTKVFSPWGRVDTRQQKKQHDLEEGMSPIEHSSTENASSSPIATRRMESAEEGNRPFSGPPKSGTFPQSASGHPPRSSGKDEAPISSSEVSKDSTDNSDPVGYGGASKEVDDNVDRSAGPQDSNGKPRKRKLRKFWKKGDTDEPQESTDNAENDDSKKKNFPKPSFMTQFKAVFGSWINLMLVFVPVGIALEYAHVDKVIVFVINFLAIIPLAALLSYATEELAMYIGEVLGGLLNATFGNAVELIVSIIALTQKKILIVQTSLIGSMLSNLLLVMGMCFFFGGLRRTEQFFNVTVAQTAASLLALAIGSLIIPTAFKIFANNDSGVAPTSRGTAVLLLVTYACYLIFQLRTHVDMYNEPGQKSPKKPKGKKDAGEALKSLAHMGATSAKPAGGEVQRENIVQDDAGDEEETPQLSKVGALVTLAVSTVLIALCAEFMVSAINEVAKSVSQEFIGLILLPIVGNAAEHATAVTVAIKDKMDLAIGVAVGSSLQVALLVLPFMVLLNWFGVGSPVAMTLSFDGFQVSVLFIAIIVVNYLIQVCPIRCCFTNIAMLTTDPRTASPTGSRESSSK